MRNENSSSFKAKFIRLLSVVGSVGLLPVSRSAWYSRIALGRYPKPVRIGPRTSAWLNKDISPLIFELAEGHHA